MSAVPLSAVGGESPKQVAVKVVEKLTFTQEKAVECDRYVAIEIEILTLLAGSPGVVQLLSWTEGLFDVHLAFPMYPCSLHDYIGRGRLKIGSSRKPDMMPSICKQLLVALSHVHELKIIHRDLKPSNMLVDESTGGDISSAVGDLKQLIVVLADFGGACQMEVSATANASFRHLPGGRLATTYQYRAPELFVNKHLRSCSYATDVWAMGVSVVEMDHGTLPFGRVQMKDISMDEIFCHQLKVLYRTTSVPFNDKLRNNHASFLTKLSTCTLREVHSLPWGGSRSFTFKKFMRKFFDPYPPSRPLANQLVRDKALAK